MANPVEAFLQEKEKRAGFWARLGNAFKGGLAQQALGEGVKQTMGEAIARGAGQAAIPALITAGAAAIATGASKGMGAITERFGKARDYKAMMQVHPGLADKDPGQTQLYYNSLRRMAPSLAKDPLVAGSFVRNMMELQPEGGPAVPLQTAKLLTDAQKSVTQAKAGRGPIAEAFMAGKQPFLEMQRQQPRQMGEDRYGFLPEQEGGGWGMTAQTLKHYE